MLLLAATLVTAPLIGLRTSPAQDSTRTMNGVTMPETITVGEQALSLNGMALRKKFVFKVYVAGLYVATRSTSPDEILGADAPRRMVMHFVRSVDKGKICDGWLEGLEKNTPEASAELKGQFSQLCDLTTDIKDGESFVFTYVPGTGTTMDVAGVEKGIIAGKEFADAMLRCWIGPKPGPGDGFKKGVLGVAD
jgi:Chalcone isomerase-like